MARLNLPKKARQRELMERLKADPFLTDEELSDIFHVSIQTIRLDRLELGIPELRERIKTLPRVTMKRSVPLADRRLWVS